MVIVLMMVVMLVVVVEVMLMRMMMMMIVTAIIIIIITIVTTMMIMLIIFWFCFLRLDVHTPSNFGQQSMLLTGLRRSNWFSGFPWIIALYFAASALLQSTCVQKVSNAKQHTLSLTLTSADMRAFGRADTDTYLHSHIQCLYDPCPTACTFLSGSAGTWTQLRHP